MDGAHNAGNLGSITWVVLLEYLKYELQDIKTFLIVNLREAKVTIKEIQQYENILNCKKC